MEMTQYQKDFVRMLDSMRDTSKGAISCIGIDADKCEKCLLADICNTEILYSAEKVIEIVTRWAKEHPVMTMADKYKEVFGVEPKKNNGDYVCPQSIGFINVACYQKQCEDCMEGFWRSEYKPPKVNKERVSE